MSLLVCTYFKQKYREGIQDKSTVGFQDDSEMNLMSFSLQYIGV